MPLESLGFVYLPNSITLLSTKNKTKTSDSKWKNIDEETAYKKDLITRRPYKGNLGELLYRIKC
jgi:hypothetical protein